MIVIIRHTVGAYASGGRGMRQVAAAAVWERAALRTVSPNEPTGFLEAPPNEARVSIRPITGEARGLFFLTRRGASRERAHLISSHETAPDRHHARKWIARSN